MQTDILNKLADEIKQDQIKEKCCVIEDIFKAYKCLIAMQVCGFEDILTKPERKFDELYDLNMEQLDCEWSVRMAQISRRAVEISESDNE